MAYTPASLTAAGLSLPSWSAAVANRSFSVRFAAPRGSVQLWALLRERAVQLLALLRERPVQLLALFIKRFFGVPAGCAAAKILRSQGAHQGQHANGSCNDCRDNLRVHMRNLVHRGLG